MDSLESPVSSDRSLLRFFRPRARALLSAALCAATAAVASGAPCDPPILNPVVCENSKLGNPASEWDVAGSGDPSIQGFATEISVDHGETVRFKVVTNATDYRMDIYRLGYYDGMGARKIATVQPSASLPQSQPSCLNDPATGLNDCGNWAESAHWDVPANAVSGIYIAKLVREDSTPGESHVVFIVRDDGGHSALLFQTSDTTWQAYNQAEGNSLYGGAGPGGGAAPGRAYKVSYNRPFLTRDADSGEDWLFNSEYPMVRWLESNGYDVSYFTGADADRRGAEILEHQAYLSVGHDEYWSGGQRSNVEAARGAGVHLAFFSGNEIFWKTRWENSIDGSGTSHRTLVCYKETHENAKIDPSPAWTGSWRDNRPINPQPSPENALSGQLFTVNCCSYAMAASADDGRMRLWRNTSVADLTGQQVATFPSESIGYEWDEDLDNGFRPPGLFRMSGATFSVPQRILDQGSSYGPGTATHTLTLYRHSSGALVFGAGTVQWPWGLDAHHDRGSHPSDVRMQQATVNLFADMGVQPGSLQGGLALATGSPDHAPPSSQVVFPADGGSVPASSTVTITGTASDSGGEVAGIEVSTDGGATWHRAAGRSNWSYAWIAPASGSAVIKSRAVDDSANLETPGAGVAITLSARACPCSIWDDTFTPAIDSANDGQPIETGVKFRSDAAGFLTAVRFYKGAGNAGTHTAHLWSSAGVLLGTATFVGETASGWQQANFASPIPISADTTYVASSFSQGGGYAATNAYFPTAYDSPPLHALADGFDGSNGVYNFGSSGFPASSFNQANYWIDVVFATSAGTDTTAPTILSVSPASGASAVNAQSNVLVNFSEAMNAASITSSTVELRDGASALVSASVTYDPATLRATLNPTSALALLTAYTATAKGGPSGVQDAAGNALASDFSWSFTTAGPPPPPPDEGPGGPILVVSGTNQFGKYFAEILRAEGLNEFEVRDLSTVTPATLGNFDVVVLGETGLSGAQVTMFSDWVTAGGNLIAMRPDKQLSGLLGLTDAGTTLSNAYLQVNTAAAPGLGIVGATIQYHGTADAYTLNGATSVATLYTTDTVATASPAVTLYNVGSSGGSAAAFTFDLARSIVYTRQGNPAWAGDPRDSQAGPIRSDNLFFGAKPGNVQPDWVDFTRIQIPQADEQQRLLANLIGLVNLDRKPLPRFWYFPKGKKAVVVMTGDDHAGGGTAGRFEANKAASPGNCSVADWDCVRSTSYVYTGSPLSDAQAAAYDAEGFEVGLHVSTNCEDFTPASLEANLADQLAEWRAKYTGLSSPVTNRTHCIAWSDWATHPKVELAHGIRFDTNYYYWPAPWVGDRPGLFTGSGMPMRFADTDGTMIDVYQATTQMTDESGQSYPLHADILLDNALNAAGYYGAFTANMHTDSAGHAGSDAIVNAAKTRGVPIVSSRQMLTWLDGRNNSSFQGLSWSGNALNFSIAAASGANNLQAIVPTHSAVGDLTGLTRNGSPVAFSRQTVKGVEYAFFAAASGAHVAQYAVDATAPAISGLASTPGSGGTATIAWTTDEPSTSRVDFGTSASTLGSNAGDSVLRTSHSVLLSGLSPATAYFFRVTSVDASNNSATSPNPPAEPATFTEPSASFVDTTVADFSAGTPSAATDVAQIGDGEILLKGAVSEEFNAAALPATWASAPWNAGGTATVAGGALSIDGAFAGSSATYGSGRSLEFVATLGGNPNQHLGFAVDLNNDPNWAIFSVKNDGSFNARTNGPSTTETPLSSALLGSPHRYRVAWSASTVAFSVDGVLVATHNASFGSTQMRPAASDLTVGGSAIVVDWVHMSPFSPSGTFDSRVFDAGQIVGWGNLSWTSSLPSGTAVSLSTRTGDAPVPDGSWTAFTPVANGGTTPGSSRYIQYRALLTTSDVAATPVLQDVTLGYSVVGGDTTAPTIATLAPSPNAADVAPDANVSVQFSEPMNASTINSATIRLRRQGAPGDLTASVSLSGNTATLDPNATLLPSTIYTATVAGTVTDTSGNPLGSDAVWTFTTAMAAPTTLTDTTVAEFTSGAVPPSLTISEIVDGEILLQPAVGSDFSGSSLPAGWSASPWGGGGAAVLSGGRLIVDGARATTDSAYTPGVALEFVATFGPTHFQHVGFVVDSDFDAPWIIFSTGNTTDTLFTRTNSGSDVATAIPGNWIGSPHRYRIEWGGSNVAYFIDGALVHTDAIAIASSLKLVASDNDAGGSSLSVDWIRLSPYAPSGTFLSRVFDAGSASPWTALASNSVRPAGTAIALSFRTGDTAVPDGTWTAFVPVSGTGGPISATARYLQYRAELSTSDPLQTPTLQDVTLSFLSPGPNSPPVASGNSYSTAEDTPLTVVAPGILGNDTDTDGDALTASLVSGPGHGASFTLNADGSFAYTPASNYYGPDSFTYKASDGTADSNVATVSITVTPVNDNPIVTNPSGQTAVEGALVSLSIAASDPDGDTLTYSATGLPSGLSINPTTGVIGGTVAPGASATSPYSVTATATDSGALQGSTVFSFAVTPSSPAGLPAGWSTQDVGAVGLAGNASFSSGTFTVGGSGIDIGGTSDQFRFAYRVITGDGEIRARITAVPNVNGGAKAGVMIRDGLAANAANAMALLSPAARYFFQRRVTVGGTTSANQTNVSMPSWVRLVRAGNTISSYRSSNGTSWILIASASVPMGNSVLVGLAVVSHDNAQICSATFDNVSVTGNSALETTITSSPSNPSNSSGPVFGFGSTPPGASFLCQIDGGSFTACSTPQSYAGLADGPHSFAVAANNGSQTDPTPAAYAWTIDTIVPPAASITSGPSNPSTSDTANFVFSDSEAGVTFQCQLDGAGFSPCSSPQPYSALTATSHTFSVRAVDAAGNMSTPATFTWTISLPAGGLPAGWSTQDVGAVGLAGNASFSSGTFTVGGSGIDIGGTSDQFRFAYRVITGDGEIRARITAVPNVNGGAKAGVMIRDGLAANAANAMALLSPAARYFFQRRVTVGGTTSANQTNVSMPSWVRLVRAGNTISSYRSSNGTSWILIASASVPMGNSVLVGLAVVSHDNAQICSATFDNVSVTGNSALETTITSSPSNPSNSSGPVFGFGSTPPGASFLCQIDGGSFTACSTPQSYAGLADGPHSFAVAANNGSQTDPTPAAYAWTIDTIVPPAASITSGPSNPSASDSANFDFSDSEAGVAFQCQLDGAGFSPCSSPQPYSALTATSHTFSVRAVDAAGNMSTPATFTWTISLPAGGLPAGWSTQDVGAVGLAGNASFSSGTFTVGGSGIDIGGTSDQFRFAYRVITGDGEIRARITAVPNVNGGAKAGVMIRDGLAANAANAMALLSPAARYFFQRRVTVGGTTSANQTNVSMPSWVRLVRAGNTISSYRSSNGTSWILIASASVPMGNSVLVGLAVVSHDNAQICSATFDNVSVTGN